MLRLLKRVTNKRCTLRQMETKLLHQKQLDHRVINTT